MFYKITVQNLGGTSGEYNLIDKPEFDNDIFIQSASFLSTAPGVTGGGLTGSGPWNLGSDVNILAGDNHVYDIIVSVGMDLSNQNTPGDGIYTVCEDGTQGNPQPGEGLFNASYLDVNDDGIADETDEACGDLPYVTHEKQIDQVVQTGARAWDVYYHIIVRNLGGATGEYTLSDQPHFDDDIVIVNGNYNSTAPGVAGGSLNGNGPWTLGSNVLINKCGGKFNSSPAKPKPTRAGWGLLRTSSAVPWTDSAPKCRIPFIKYLETIPKSLSASSEAL